MDEKRDTWSQAFRLECEARYLLRQPLAFRQEYLKHPNVAGRRTALEAEMTRQFRAR